MVELNNFRLWAQDFRCYEQLRAIDDTKKKIPVMSLGLLMIWAT